MRIKNSIAFTIVLSLAFFVAPRSAHATYDPRLLPNNKVGIHILSESELPDAASLVNSNGGSWGYITFVIREDERDTARWTRAFKEARTLHLIPIVRIATTSENAAWKEPKSGDARTWAEFLDTLPWPIQNRYVILFNEPNHPAEWGGTVNPQEYAQIARAYWEQLKRASADFFVLPAGFDAAAPNSKGMMAIETYFAKMYEADPLVFSLFDGWTSHSYPNPAFSGSVDDQGKTSIRGYQWEVAHLARYDIYPNLPIFITETGWSHKNLKEQTVAQNYKKAFETAWNDNNIVAVTPFVLSYSQKPFQVFSWKESEGRFREAYHAVQSLTKISGEPKLATKELSELGFVPY